MVGRGVGLELAMVPGFTGWGWPPAFPYSDTVARGTTLALDPGLTLVQ